MEANGDLLAYYARGRGVRVSGLGITAVTLVSLSVSGGAQHSPAIASGPMLGSASKLPNPAAELHTWTARIHTIKDPPRSCACVTDLPFSLRLFPLCVFSAVPASF